MVDGSPILPPGRSEDRLVIAELLVPPQYAAVPREDVRASAVAVASGRQLVGRIVGRSSTRA